MKDNSKVLDGLQYIADSPPCEYGGFHPETVEIAKAALDLITETQTGLFDNVPPLPQFNGKTYIDNWDADRLTGQWQRVWNVMTHVSGTYLTLDEMQNWIQTVFNVHDSQTGISARIRDFRKARWGGHTVNSRRRGDKKSGVWEYQLVPRQFNGSRR